MSTRRKAREGGAGVAGASSAFLRQATARAASLAALPAQAAAELAALEQELGGRQALVTALTYAPQTRDLRYALGLLADPDHQRMPLAEVCRLGHILPGALVDALAKGMELRARLLATQRITRRLPAVVADVMEKAAPYEDDCMQCQGLGQVTPDPTPQVSNPTPEPCRACQGTGRLRFDADASCRELALELGGLTGKGGGGGVHVAVGVGVQALHGTSGAGLGGGALERMQEALDDLLYGADGASPAVIDVEAVPAEDTAPADGEAS